jgi:hypothetical protein
VSVIIKIKSKEVVPMPQLFRLALKFIYDKVHMSLTEAQQMEDSVINWANAIKLKEDLGSSEYENEKYQLGFIAMLLKQNDEGKLDERKKMFKKFNISYGKYYRLPEFYHPSDFIRAQAEYEKLCRINPEENL